MNLSLPILTGSAFRDNSIRKIRRVDRIRGDRIRVVRGNSKLGRSIWTFSLPPVSTCPTATRTCLRHCYAVWFYNRFVSLRLPYRNNQNATTKSDFSKRIIQIIRQIKHITAFRIHPSGEFYSSSYIRKWVQIVRELPHVRFFAYTRAWLDLNNLPALRELSLLHNMRLWLSTDRETGLPPEIPATRIAYMSVGDDDIPSNDPDLIFRVRRKKPRIRLGRSLVCPVENGTPNGAALTCQQCRICFHTAWKHSFTR